MPSFQIIDDKEKISCSEAESKYKNAQYLMVDVEYTDGETYGTLYAISRDSSTFDQLIDLENKLQEEGTETLIGGEYASSLFNDIELINMRKVSNG